MTGLSVVYAKEATEESEWRRFPRGPTRPPTGGVLGAPRRVELPPEALPECRRNLAAGPTSDWQTTGTTLATRSSTLSPGPEPEDRFEWLEVTEVFTTVRQTD